VALDETSIERAGADDPVDVGRRIREYRKLRHATLKNVAAKAGVSESFLSQLERGRTSASLATFRQIASVLGMSVGDLFEAKLSAEPQPMSARDRPTLQFGHLVTKQLLTPKPFRNLEVFLGDFEPGGTTGPEPLVHGHSEELVLVLSGTVQLTLGDQVFVLAAGDSINYDSSTPHKISETEGRKAQVLWVISPPSY
jgi:transcriptional regulator with XRE-family HTH domain